MRRVLTNVLLGVLLTTPVFVHAQDHPHQPANFSLFYPVSTNQDPTISTSFRLNLMYGHIGSVRGVDLNGMVSRIDRDMSGLQLTGLYSHVGGDLGAVALTGGVNYAGGRAKGLQVAGLVNYDRGAFSGFQWAALMNFVEGGYNGVQWSAVFNLNNGDGGFLQWGTFANATAGSFRGLQISTGVNFVNEEMGGIQLGLTNFVTNFHGAQIGAFNAARNAEGPQIGILNISRNNTSVPVGLASFADSSNTDWVSFASSYAIFNTGIRTAVRGFYSMLTAGVGDIKDERSDTAFLTWNYGYAWELGADSKWRLSPDLGWVHIMPQPSDTKNDRQQFAVQARLLLELQISNDVSVFAGGGMSVRFSEYSTSASSEADGLGVLGISLF